jgi:hypothetical protein
MEFYVFHKNERSVNLQIFTSNRSTEVIIMDYITFSYFVYNFNATLFENLFFIKVIT